MIAIELGHGRLDDVIARLRGARGLFVLASDSAQAIRAEDAQASFVGCDPIATHRGPFPPSERGDELAWAGRRAAPRWVGFAPYESARHLERSRGEKDQRRAPPVTESRWYRYGAVVRVDHASGRIVVEGDDAAYVHALVDRLRAPIVGGAASTCSVSALEWNDDDATHAAKVARIIEYIRAGDVYQVNLARRASFALRGEPLAFFRALFAAAPSPFGFFLDADGFTIVGASPELALDVDGRRLRTTPIKGTRARGADAERDRMRQLDLDADPKERAELTMAIDLHRNDFGKVAAPGSVRVLGDPHIAFGRTVMSRVAEIVAELEDGRTAGDALVAMLPAGSVTGAPKVRAMEIIAELEAERRGLYTGMIGTVRRDGGVTLAMAIRTAVIGPDGRAEYFAGGGIVLGSDPAREADETRWKAEQLASLVR